MTFLSPMWLWGLLLVPVLVGLAIAWERQRGVAARAFADARVMSVGADRGGRLLRQSALALAILAVAMGPIALARPAVDATEEKRQGAVMLAIDTSLSMNKDDLKPSRLVAAREAANRFLDAAPDEVRVGLVTFDEKAVVRVAPNWAGMVQSRLPLLEQAAAKVLGQPRQVVLETGEPSQQKQPPQPAAPAPVASPEAPPANPKPAAVAPTPPPEAPATTPAAPPTAAATPTPAAEPPAAPPKEVPAPPLPASSGQLEQQAKRFADFFDGAVVSDDTAA